MRDVDRVLIVGGGIAGLATALTLHQIGVRCQVFEAVVAPKPMGVGINIQPNAVRELFAMGISAALLDTIGIEAKEWALVGLSGRDIYAEPRGRSAGYRWPQYAIHRGHLQMLLLKKVMERLGPDAVCLGHKALGYTKREDGLVDANFKLAATGEEVTYRGRALIGADGIHSVIRAQMHPEQPPIHWGGCIMWRGVTPAKAIRTGSSFVGLGTADRRLVMYPISQPDHTGLSLVNWIVEEKRAKDEAWAKAGWFTETPIDAFINLFDDMKYDWLDVPQLISGAARAFENPMIDRDPLDSWQDGPVLLLGDAAHPMYPTGSNGASQAIVDARHLGAAFLKYGVNHDALAAFDDAHREMINAIVLRNRNDGPFGLLSLVDDRCDGQFDNIDDIVPAEERADFMFSYRSAAGFARDALNAAPSIIPDHFVMESQH